MIYNGRPYRGRCISKIKWVRLSRTHTIFSLVPQHISRCEASLHLRSKLHEPVRAHFVHKEKPHDFSCGFFFVLALPIFPASHPASIVGEGELNFCVRDGNRWTLTPINTNSSEQTSYPSPRPKVQGSLIPLFLLSKSQPLRWVAILSGYLDIP